MANIINVSKEVEKYTINFLGEQLPHGFYASDFTQQLFDSLLNGLISEYGGKEALGRMPVVQTCLHEHFKALGQETEIKIYNRTIKVIKKIKSGIKSVDVDRAYIKLNPRIDKLAEDEEKYALLDNLLCFPPDVLTALYETFEKSAISGDEKKIRPLIRASIIQNFELDKKDIVLFMRKKVYVRGFVDISVLKSENQRFMGASPEELEQLYLKHFPKEFEEVLIDLAPDVFDDALDFTLMDNMTFRSKYINIFRALVDVAMADYTSGIDEQSVIALNGYVLRIHFDKLVQLCAQKLIDLVMKRDKNADIFLRFYNGETVLDGNGKKIKKPFIVDVNNNTWNYNSIFSIMTQYDQYLLKHDKQVDRVEESENFYKHAATETVSTRQRKKESIEKTRIFRSQHANTALVVKKLDSMENPSKENLTKLRKERSVERELKKKYDHSFENEAALTIKLKNLIVAEQNRLKQFRAAELSLENLEKRGADLELQQRHILSAIGKALIFR